MKCEYTQCHTPLRHGAIIWKKELGGDWGDAQYPNGVPPLGVVMDHKDDDKNHCRRRVGVPICREGNGSRGTAPLQGVHQEAADDHSGEGGLTHLLFYVHGGGADARDNPVGAMLGSRRVGIDE